MSKKRLFLTNTYELATTKKEVIQLYLKNI